MAATFGRFNRLSVCLSPLVSNGTTSSSQKLLFSVSHCGLHQASVALDCVLNPRSALESVLLCDALSPLCSSRNDSSGTVSHATNGTWLREISEVQATTSTLPEESLWGFIRGGLGSKYRIAAAGTCRQLLRMSCGSDGGIAFSYRARGFAAKAKKSNLKTRSDEDGNEAVESMGPSAKETAMQLMDAAMDALSMDLSKLRTGRASPGMLDHVTVDAHGVRTPLSHLAAVSVSNLETLTVMPYDPSTVKEVEKAILSSPLRLNPVPEGQILKVPIPKLTKEHCELVQLVGKSGEMAKLSIRRGRKDAMDLLGKGSGLSKDEMKRHEKEIEELTKKYVKSVDETCKRKEKEILAG